ncbi:hypothetical protein RO3G_14337 [Rhizopus delemar RA 99-880]|uniref:Uncharacterized protein n=1 Tax=Rhizopus delemar (strain RA 99-880 / ATCC MYA-4621 / FGSC 9543 / NRRL 43880) TaxID=246409 RepID=I1CME6_RHIO9|nr:hypothetical protein RO3G_14337 [Rhizopus delemar RA 99-880]|eukprot:EIE89626.1 hypothetical protein RO3G_14337 [Rhizopus delemar RA 99-880]
MNYYDEDHQILKSSFLIAIVDVSALIGCDISCSESIHFFTCEACSHHYWFNKCISNFDSKHLLLFYETFCHMASNKKKLFSLQIEKKSSS